jgi:hypothetical protein
LFVLSVGVSFTYGEIDYLSLATVLTKVISRGGWSGGSVVPSMAGGGVGSGRARQSLRGKAKPVFYDLGAGMGKGVFTAALMQGTFAEVNGIELLETLHQASLDLQKVFLDMVRGL